MYFSAILLCDMGKCGLNLCTTSFQLEKRYTGQLEENKQLDKAMESLKHDVISRELQLTEAKQVLLAYWYVDF